MDIPSWWAAVIDEMTAHQRAHPENLPGAVFAAETASDGRLIECVGAGWTPATICQIGSMTKAVTATAVLLALEGHDRLDVEAPVGSLPGMEAWSQDPVKRSIRVRHLLQHTSGLPALQRLSEVPEQACRHEHDVLDLKAGPTVPWIGAPGDTNEHVRIDGRCVPARLASLEQVSDHVMRTYPVSGTPGAAYSYSTANYVVAARIVECLTARPFHQYVKEYLLTPLGMRDSFFVAQPNGDPRWDEGVTSEQRARIADVTLLTRDGRLPPEIAPGPDDGWDKLRRHWRFVYPDGGMYSTAGDLLTFLAMIRDGGTRGSRRILSPAITRLLVEDQGFGHTMGFGVRAGPSPYGQRRGTLEHMGHAMTYFWFDPGDVDSILGVFLSQRLTNIAVDNNMADGMRVIFRLFVPLLMRRARR